MTARRSSPDAWSAAWKWFYDAMWTDHFTMTGPVFESPEANPSDYPFFTGNVAMSQNYLWSTYGAGDWVRTGTWRHAVVPGPDDRRVRADTFRIH
jgi:hypothetical protein